MDWPKIIRDLEVIGGMTRVEIAAAVPCSPPQITDLASGKRGKRLDYNIADGLRALHKERCSSPKRAKQTQQEAA